MDLSTFHLIDPALVDSVRETVSHAVHTLTTDWAALANSHSGTLHQATTHLAAAPFGSHGFVSPDFTDPSIAGHDFANPAQAAPHHHAGPGRPGHDAPGHDDDGKVELAETKPGEKPATEKPAAPDDKGATPPERKVVEGTVEKKDVPGAGGPSAAGVDFSIWGIVSRADPIAKVVIGVLAFASVWSWAIIFEKIIAVRSVNRRSDKFEDRFWSGGSVDALYEEVGRRPNSPMAALFAAAMREWRQSTTPDHNGQQTIVGGVKERIERVMNVTLGREMGRLERNVGFLATVGATAPFIGLFGTVWGIMSSFQHIAVQKNTNLATVAPGISEALFATALGLLAAIPAVVAYNRFSGQLDRYAHRLEGFTGEFTAIVSRQLEGGVR
ncbi:MAG: protein TolQ [Rhodospirillaceae bacterium]|nr:protein TolQ [Rhodospirillaceae bacterium]